MLEGSWRVFKGTSLNTPITFEGVDSSYDKEIIDQSLKITSRDYTNKLYSDPC